MKKIMIILVLVALTFEANAQWSGVNPVWTGSSVGIGTSSPIEKLDIRGNLNINSGIDDNHIYWGSHYMTMGTRIGDYAHNILKLEPGGATQGPLYSVLQMYLSGSETDHSLKIQLHTSGNSFFNGGNVGIGTNTPTQKLEVAGNIMTSGSGDIMIRQANTKITGGGHMVFTANGHELERLDGNNSLVLFNGGNVLIGKSSQTNGNYKLDVAGSIRANEIKVNLDGADFVFENNYKLRPLTELEKYVRENKHLPGIESAGEMEANGTDLGKLNTKLLQKIEELTLYTIEQNKKIDKLEKQVQILTKRLK